ncbi:hypothetical protein PRK78_003687 [Emydomyces testavorans]|uniref:Chromo domain-containing protein n=1 Tax=Emydomyces testavorans TaxID=2070801 RepID=A0AAF0DHC2_9EURO|nr:hypothetical protein PRK78_003687 [Emydomyces testavorans]
MPPPLDFSEEESGGESIPFNDPKQEAENADETANQEESESESEDVYVVEKIMGHEWGKNGKLLFQVKWKGYENPEDMTLEPEENLDGAPEAILEYFAKIGGRPEKPTKKRKSAGAVSTPDRVPAKKSKKALRSVNGTPDTAEVADWLPKSNDWDPEVRFVETIIRDGNNLYALLHWNNDKKTRVSLQQCYEKCPQRDE